MKSRGALLLDTHVWLHYVEGLTLLRASVIDAIEEARMEEGVFVSVISVWEIALLVRLRRVALSHSVVRWTEQALARPGIRLLAFTADIAIAAVDLPEPMHKDPADRILVASARLERMTLVTRDQEILAFAKATKLSVLEA